LYLYILKCESYDTRPYTHCTCISFSRTYCIASRGPVHCITRRRDQLTCPESTCRARSTDGFTPVCPPFDIPEKEEDEAKEVEEEEKAVMVAGT
jgi:hypothetical protein